MNLPKIKKRSPDGLVDKKEKVSFLKRVKSKEKFEVKRVSQKRMDFLFWSFFIGMVGLCLLTVLLSFTRELRPVQVEQPEIVEVDKTEVDNRLQEFLGQYIETYFNMPEGSEERRKQIDNLNSFYNFVPDVVNMSQKNQVLSIISYRPVEIKEQMASYRVTYEIGNEDKKRVTVLFSIPFGGEDGAYYVAGLPNFKPVEDYRTETVDEENKLRLTAQDGLSEEERAELDDFVKLFFANYTTSQENLDVISSDLRSIKGVNFVSLDYSYYKIGEKKTKAYVQVTFEVLGQEHSENFTLTLEAREKGYFVTNLEYVIPTNYSR